MAPVELKYTLVDDISSIHDSLKAEFLKGKSRSIEFRKQQLSQFAYMMKDNLPLFKEALKQDLGKPEFEALLSEMSLCIDETVQAYNKVDKWAKPEKAPFNLNFTLLNPRVLKEPKGVVLIIGAYNYPAFVTFSPMAGAIAAGNAVVLKPSETSSAMAALVTDLFPKYLDPSMYRIVNGAIPETTKLLELKWDHIMYTGNGKVGRIVAAAAAKHLTPVSLELGGKNPVFIDPSYDLKLAAKRLSWGRFSNAGQTCTAPDYILIPTEAQDKLVAAFTEVYNAFYPDGPLKSESYARIGSDAQFARIKALLDDTKGDVVLGGETDAEQKYIAPTVVRDVSPEDSLMSQEIFGPILAIVPVKDMDEAIAFVNARDHPLAAYAFTSDAKLKKKLIDNTQSGAIAFNETLLHAAIEGLPFGGIGESGTGHHSGKWGFNTFTHFRSTFDAPKFAEIALNNRYPPYSEKKSKLMEKLMLPRMPPRVGASPSLAARIKAWLPALLCVLLAAGIGTRLTQHTATLAFVQRLLSSGK
ncbi:aldehyde dehydrogenase [Phellopilus nigrolimitatus]|nr:aldehyde dehydrogenase [Phellopilus nigrolimitatus]